MTRTAPLAALLAAGALTGCTTIADAPRLPAAQEAFWDALASHCGKAYAGTLVGEDARDADFRGKRMLAHWADCSPTRVAVAFHVESPALPGGWDRSRTWVVSRNADGLRLKHDHRHADGSEDAMTQYGGDTADAGTARRQDFPVDAQSIALFERDGLDASLTNVWRVEVDPAGAPNPRFAYQLTRRNDPTRRFRVEFDAGTPVPAPPAAWGW